MKSVEVCRHCGADIRLHPITRAMMTRNSEFTKPCMLDYTPQAAYPLPFNTRSLNEDDKIELQDYWTDQVRR